MCIGDEILGTPADAAEAVNLLERLSGREHEVLTAIAFKLGERMEAELSVTAVRFRELGRSEIERYVATGEPMDKAGAYAIQGRAGGVHHRDPRQLFRRDGPAAVRDRAAAAPLRHRPAGVSAQHARRVRRHPVEWPHE